MSTRPRKRGSTSSAWSAAPESSHPETRVRRKRGGDAAPTYASFWRRFAAWLIDAVLTTPALLMLSRLFDRAGLEWIGDPIYDGAPAWLDLAFLGSPLDTTWLFLVGRWLYEAAFLSSAWQATPGKRATGVFVTDLVGERISFGRASARAFATHLSWIALIGYLIQPFTAKRQALHDLIAGTVVVRKRPV